MKIVMTGPPESGKTALTLILQYQFPKQMVVVPDVLNYCLDLPKAKTLDGKRSLARLLFGMQKEIENLVTEGAKQKLILCDRGTLDHLANLETNSQFWEDLHTSLDSELHRYDLVIQMGRDPNSLWNQHPRILKLSSDQDFAGCASKVISSIKRILGEDNSFAISR